jgi:5-guanidino-2-oxopentanoate decarboxylase
MAGQRTCGEALVALLEDYGVDTVFGIPGVHTLELYRGLPGSGIRHVLPRHEQGAGFMADGYARASGKPGVCFLITGPGVTNAATPMGQAYSDSVPMLVISSVNATGDLGKGWGRLHEITDQRAVTAPLTAFSATAYAAAEVPELVARAFAVFASARPRPVHIELPLDVLAAPAEGTWKAESPPPRPAAPNADIWGAAALLGKAERPFIIAGGGALEAGAAITEIAERAAAMVATTSAGKGVVPDSHPLSLGATLTSPAVQARLADADVVLAIGTEMAETDVWNDRLSLSGQLIRIDIDPAKVDDFYPASLGIVADAVAAAEGILHALGGEPGLRRALPADAVVANDMTQIAYTGSNAFPAEKPRVWFHPSGFGTLGYALPAAIGAKIAAPSRPVSVLVGDAGLMFTLPELAVAVELELPIPIVLWNNDALGQIRDDMIEKGIPEIAVRGRNPDFLAVAQGFGCKTARPDSLAAIEEAVRAALKASGPTLIEVHQDAGFLK